MKILVLAEVEFDTLRPASLAAVHCARQLAGESGGSVTWLLLGHESLGSLRLAGALDHDQRDQPERQHQHRGEQPLGPPDGAWRLA